MYGDWDDMDDFDTEYGEGDDCPECQGTGQVCDCCDDICAARGDCIHGDGMSECPACGGNGYL